MVEVGQKKGGASPPKTDTRFEKLTTGENQIVPTRKIGVAGDGIGAGRRGGNEPIQADTWLEGFITGTGQTHRFR